MSSAFAVTARRSSRAARPSASRRPDATARSSSAAIRSRPLAAASAVVLDADDAIAGVERRDRDARAHQPGPDDADRPDRSRRDAFSPATLAAARSAKKTWRSALASSESRSRRNVARSSASPSAQRALAGATHQPDRLAGRLLAARSRQCFRGCLVDGIGVGEGDGKLAGATQRLAGEFSRGGDAAAAIRSFGTTRSTMPSDSASAAATMRPVAIISTATADPDEARQALRAAGAGNDAELHLGQAELRLGGGDADDGRRARSPGRRRAPRR